MTTHLGEQMIEDTQLRVLAERSQEMYVSVVRKLKTDPRYDEVRVTCEPEFSGEE